MKEENICLIKKEFCKNHATLFMRHHQKGHRKCILWGGETLQGSQKSLYQHKSIFGIHFPWTSWSPHCVTVAVPVISIGSDVISLPSLAPKGWVSHVSVHTTCAHPSHTPHNYRLGSVRSQHLSKQHSLRHFLEILTSLKTRETSKFQFISPANEELAKAGAPFTRPV